VALVWSEFRYAALVYDHTVLKLLEANRETLSKVISTVGLTHSSGGEQGEELLPVSADQIQQRSPRQDHSM
jgi:hypothetical protein